METTIFDPVRKLPPAFLNFLRGMETNNRLHPGGREEAS